MNKHDPHNIIRVDAPPADENARSIPIHELGLLNEKPVIRPARSRRMAIPKEANHVMTGSLLAASLPQPAPEPAPSGGQDTEATKIPDRFTPRVEVVGSKVGSPPPLKASLPPPLPEEPEIQPSQKAFPLIAGALATIFIATGVILFSRGNIPMTSDEDFSARSRASVTPISATQVKTETAPAELNQAQPLFSESSPPAPKPVTVTDQVRHQSMAPQRSSLIFVQPKEERTYVRGGPGSDFPVLGILNPSAKYIVAEWKDQWFKVEIEKPISVNAKVPMPLIVYGWVRNDLVELVKSGNNIEAHTP